MTIYLDFDGETVEGVGWNREQGEATLVFTEALSADASYQHEVWARVAEDYAPFNVNVTTTLPSDEVLYKSSSDDNEYGVHVVITDSYDDVLDAAAGSGGLAYNNSAGSWDLSPVFVFTPGTGGGAKAIADSASHEAGHAFGLTHDGIDGSDYYAAGSGIWGPIMGAPYAPPLSQWSNGGYAGATNTEDDVVMITDRGAKRSYQRLLDSNGNFYSGGGFCGYNGSNAMDPQSGDKFQAPVGGRCDGTGEILSYNVYHTDRADYRVDTVGNTRDTAAALDNSTGAFTASNVILTRDDVDVYSFATDGGAFKAEVKVVSIGANLDVELTLTDSAGTVVASANPPASVDNNNGIIQGLAASITLPNLDAGRYFLAVDGVGQGDPDSVTPDEANGYNDYGSLGNYTIAGSAAPFVVDPIVIVSPVEGAEVAYGEINASGTSEPDSEVTLTVGGTAFGPVKADQQGKWSMPINVDYGMNAIIASQSFDGVVESETDTATVNVPVPAPVITAPVDGATVNSVTFGGTGIPGAQLTVTYALVGGAAQTAAVIVGSDGSWTLAPSGLAEGDYTVSAVQAINGVTSPGSALAAFVVVVNDDDEEAPVVDDDEEEPVVDDDEVPVVDDDEETPVVDQGEEKPVVDQDKDVPSETLPNQVLPLPADSALPPATAEQLPATGDNGGFEPLIAGTLLLLIGGTVVVVATRKRRVSAEG